MDIKNISEHLTGKPVSTQTDDLLARLKTAGTVEAEVIRVLQGKLLLSSRLGEILTANTLNYRPGDQVRVRLGGNETHPLLKISPRVPVAIILDSGQNPRLSKVLPPDTPVLAVVNRIAAQRVEIKIAGQVLTLPRSAELASEQLLSLQRNETDRTIEITPLDRRLIYKALLKQLIPQQTQSGPASLPRLLGLVSKVVDAPGSSPTALFQSGQQPTVKPTTTAPISAMAQQPTRQQSSSTSTTPAEVRPAVAPNTNRAIHKDVSQNLIPVGRAPVVSTPGISADHRPGPAEKNHLLAKLVQQANRNWHKPGISSNLPRTITLPSTPESQLAAAKTEFGAQQRATTGNNVIAAKTFADRGSDNKAQFSTAAPSTTKSGTAPTQSIQSQSNAVPSPTPTSVAAGIVPPAVIVGKMPAAPAALPSQTRIQETPSLFQILLQMVPKNPEISAQQIKQWFEFARLIRTSKPDANAPVVAESLQSLKQLADKAVFNRELDLAMQTSARTATSTETSANKPLPSEILLAQARDGFKLIEQVLSQNLLQRSSLGLQQELQQPLSLSFALPLQDQQEVKSLHIELAQREQSQEENDKSWDIRLSFDLADLGPVSCHIFLQGTTVAASFYCQNSSTRVRVEQELPDLKHQLSVAGFIAGEFHSFTEQPEQARSATAAAYAESLVDIEV